ncbi:MAG TPA: EAL domain-containing protein [Gammaproteobacteria bacterium]|nr:EAL domain-containing protein [Gammaproteobacteria bacterium]
MRFATLIELSLELAKQRQPAEMLAMFCHATHDVMNARIAAACLLDESGASSEFAIWGLTDAQALAVRADLMPTAKLFGELLRDGEPRRLSHLDGNVAAAGLPASHPRISNFLAVPVRSATRCYGWFYVADRLGTDAFPIGDEQLARTLASQLASAYENCVLVDRITRHAALLNVEIDERKQSELRFRQLAENIREVFFLLDVSNGAMLYVSPAYERVWERSCASLYAQPQSWLDAVHADDHASAVREFSRMRTSGSFDFEYRILLPDASVRWIKTRGFPILDDSGKLYRVAGLAEDITESKLQRLSVQRLSRIHAVLSGINSAIVRIHERTALLDRACQIAVRDGGFPVAWIGLVQPDTLRTELVACSGTSPEIADQFARFLGEDAIDKRGPVTQALRSSRAAVFNDVSAEAGPSPVFRLAVEQGYGSIIALPLLADDEPAGVMVLFARESGFFDEQELALLAELAGDVSFALQYIEREEKLDYLAYYDPLTGLPNSRLFQERLSQIIERQPTGKVALFLMDLDRFTHLNDSLGRHIGDQLLIDVGKRLKDVIPEPSNLARISSDTFAIAASTLRQDTEAATILRERIVAGLSRPFQLGGKELRISARAGIALYPADGSDSGTLFTNAEAALREAKTTGARYLFYSAQLNWRVAEDLALEQELLAALERQEFVVHYQTKTAAKSGEVVGLEALLRWNSPERGLVPPQLFIRVLEDTELILDVGQWVLERALADYKTWEQKGLPVPRIAVNVSPIQLRYADFPEMVIAAIDQSGLPGEALELEITESVIMADIQSNTERLQKVSDYGVTIAIDDFGTGYSSLRYLAKLPVDTLKIDRSFIVSMTADDDSLTLVSTIIRLAHSFRLTVVAEGVDSEDQAQLLRLMKCDAMQGFLFSKPASAADIEKLLMPERQNHPDQREL